MFITRYLLLIMLMSHTVSVHAEQVLLWDQVDGSHGYRVHYGLESGRYTGLVNVGDTNVCLFSQLPLEPGIMYYFVVTAYNQNGTSGPTNEVNAIKKYLCDLDFDGDCDNNDLKLFCEDYGR